MVRELERSCTKLNLIAMRFCQLKHSTRLDNQYHRRINQDVIKSDRNAFFEDFCSPPGLELLAWGFIPRVLKFRDS